MKRKLFYPIVIAFSMVACLDNESESPANPSNSTNALVSTGPGDLDEENETSSVPKTAITQSEFDQIIANTPEGQPVVIKHRFATALTIGNPNVAGYHPDLLTFKFVDCEFSSLVVTNTGQAVLTLQRCTIQTVSLETMGIVQVMEIKRSTINELRTIDGSRCNGLTVIKSKISQIANDSGNNPNCFQVINFQ